MRRLWFLGGAGLCLVLAGCAGTSRRAVIGPGGVPLLASRAHAHQNCGCAPVRPSLPSSVLPPPPETALASGTPAPAVAPTDPGIVVATRFFPKFEEGVGVAVDPLEAARPDVFGVRTSPRERQDGQADDLEAAVPSDGKMLRTSADGEPTPLPMVMKVAARRGAPPNVESTSPGQPAIEDVVEDAPSSATPDREPDVAPMAAQEPSLPERDGAIDLEQVEDPALAGRPRLAHDGTLIVPRPRGGDPTRYGPDATYPASYYAEGAAPTSVPKTREVWPTRNPGRTSLLTRVFQRFRKSGGTGANAGAATGAGPTTVPASASASSRSKPRDLPERGEDVERVAADRLDKSSQR